MTSHSAPGHLTAPIIEIVTTEDGVQPQLAGTGRCVADVVAVAYEQGLEAAAVLAGSAEASAAALQFCAARACDEPRARCRSCRLWSDDRGLVDLEQMLTVLGERAGELRFAESDAVLTLPGQRSRAPGDTRPPAIQPGTLEAFARDWAGQEFWFLARRVLRRAKFGKARDGKLKPAGSTPDGGGAGPALILVAPQMADNIGMVARAMANFAIEDLRLVAPRDGWPNDKARFAASGAHPVIDAARAFPKTADAIADLNWVCATTARPRQLALPVLAPDAAIAEMIRRTARGERCGILFGPERTGLSTDDIANADAMVMVRVNPTFASLNLAQAVLLMGYEWMKQTGGGTIGRHTESEGVEATGLDTRSPPATKSDLAAFFDHIEEALFHSGHFKPPEKRPTMMRNLRVMFERMGATQQDVRTLRGIVVSLTRSRNTGGDTA